jgi:pimeloyl-ACP methyl ester carboxylesterase
MAETKTYYHTTAKGSRIFVEECGSGPLMVLMHGLGGTTNYFQPLISHFSSRYTMLRFDFPGSGFSTFKSAPSIPQFVEDLTSILNSRAKKESPILVGHSLGSIVAMHYASRNPEVAALVLIGPGRSASHISAAVEAMTGLAAKARQGIEGIRDSTIANNVAPTSNDLVRTVVRQMVSSQDPEGYAATCEVLCSASHVDPDYSAIECPTVLIAGDQDKISPLSRSHELKGLIEAGVGKKIVRVEVVHSGHQQVLEDTAGVVKAMESVLAL